MINYIFKIKQKLHQVKLVIVVVLFIIAYSQSINIQSQKFSIMLSLEQESELSDYKIPNISWTNVTQVSENDGFGSYNSEITSDNKGNVHVVWDDESVEYYEIFYRTYYQENNSWASIQTLCEKNTFSVYPKIIAGKNNYIHVSWWDLTGINESLLYSYYNGEFWSEIFMVTTCSSAFSPHEITASSDGSVYFFWEEEVSENNTELLFKGYSLISKEFTEKQQITLDSSWGSSSPSAITDSNNNIHLVWYAKEDDLLAYEIFYSRIETSTLNQTHPIIISQIDNISDERPEITIDSNDFLHVVWENDGVIQHRVMTSNNWLQSNKVNCNGIARSPDISIDNFGNIHFVWDESLWLMYRQYNTEKGWSHCINLTYFFTIFLNPSITLDPLGNVHIVWDGFSLDFLWEVNYIRGNLLTFLDKQIIILLTTILGPLLISNIFVVLIVLIKLRKKKNS